MNFLKEIEKDLLELHAKFHKWVRESKHDYSLNVKAEDSYSYVQADTQGAFDAFCAGMVAGMEDYERSLRESNVKTEYSVFQDFKREKCSNGGLMHQRFRTVFGVDILDLSKRQAAAKSIIGTELEVQTLELYRTHLNEFLTTKFPEPDFRVYGIGDRFYASLDESQKLYILNRFVVGSSLETTDVANERKFISHFRHKYLLEENAERVRRLAGYKTPPSDKQG